MGEAQRHVECPRCHGPATHLVEPYWESPFPGLCSACCVAAADRFDATEWPPPRNESVPPVAGLPQPLRG
jgi:hypothetical protein